MKYLVLLVLVVFPLAGAVMVVAGASGLWTTWQRRPFLRSAVGTVVSVETNPVSFPVDDEGRTKSTTAYRPVVRFTTESGEVREFVSKVSQLGDASMYRTGDTFRVLYDPVGILPPTLDSVFALWGGHLLGVVMGPIFWALAALVYVTFGRRLLGRK